MSLPRERTPEEIPLNLYTTNAPGVARVASNDPISTCDASEVRHIVLDISGLDFRFREGQSLGIHIPALADRGHSSALRFYSIASSRSGEDGLGRSLAICVKRPLGRDPLTLEEKRSAAAEYLCALEPSAEVIIAGPFGSSFLLPEDASSHLILLATGTGIAPFRGFLRRLFHDKTHWTGQIRLFLGVRDEKRLIYSGEFQRFQDLPNFQAYYAYSQADPAAAGPRVHVQDRLAEHIEDVWNLLDQDNSHLYICGIKGMEAPIEEVLASRALKDHISWRAFHRMLQDTGRLHVETY